MKVVIKYPQYEAIHKALANRQAKEYLLDIDESQIYEGAPKKTWQPIETAPKDGKPILLFDSDKRKFVGFWLSQAEVDDLDVWDCEPLESGFYCENYMGDHCERLDPTHWMPLPQPPEEK